jgi:hypothetical protein
MRRLLFALAVFIFVLPVSVIAQEEEEEGGGYEDLLFKEVEVENPVYFPVMSVGTGLFNYFGEFNNDTEGLGTMPPIKFNVYHFLDSRHIYRINLSLISGNVNGSMHEIKDLGEYQRITNFQTELFAVGINLEYGFGHFYKQPPRFRPFFSLGGEVLVFNPKSDFGQGGSPYDWNDQIIFRNYEYDYNLRSKNNFDLQSYSQNTAALTFDIGFDFALSERVEVRVANSVHYTFSDIVDGIPYKDGDGDVIGNKTNDILNFTYFTFGWDPFSESETKTEELLFAEVSGDFDYTAIADKDRDGILDLADDCPDNPRGVAVDSITGCPLDDDKDGVPNYKDKEPNSAPDAIVNENGVEMSETQIEEMVNYDMVAVEREEAYMIPISTGWKSSKYSSKDGKVTIPEKFKSVDRDNSGDISYNELLQTIDAFFNNKSDFTANEIYELNDFFFAQ